jgi:hypothetical protein
MKRSIGLFILFLIGGHTFAAGLPKKQEIAPIKDFLVDPSKPYVYLKVDHLGPRTPDSEQEPATGIYLKIVNNCRLPIIVNTFGAPAGAADYESGVMDRVVLNTTRYGDGGIEETTTWSVSVPSLLNFPEEILSPNMRIAKAKAQAEEREKAKARAEREKAQEEANAREMAGRPTGYHCSVCSFATIPPGRAVYFSVPINHVNKKWHFEIPFRFDLRVRSPIHAPKNYVSFFWEDLPEAYRRGFREDLQVQP